MKVLWLCNVMLPRISDHLKIKSKPIGGWLAGLSDDIAAVTDISLMVMFPSKNGILSGELEGIDYMGFTPEQNNSVYFVEQLKKCQPNIVHIFGTEYSHSYSMIKACKELDFLDHTIVSIQGLTSIYSKHYYCGMPFSVIHSYTFHDLIRRSNIYHGKKEFEKSGIDEISTIKIAKNVSGRTEWDYAIVNQINPAVKYYKCNEILRHSFYNENWDINKIEKYSIFVSQSNYPIKGFHLMLEALCTVIKKYPNVKLYTTGISPLKLNTIEKLKQNSYNAYLGKLINKLKLANYVVFLGELNEVEMKNRFLKSHIFVCCSSIENSPNSVGEAMLLGVPTVSADVGGVRDMMNDKVDGFIYPYDETYMLAHYIDKIFSDNNLALEFSINSQKHAALTHSREKNINRIMQIYETIEGNIIS